MSVYQWCNCLVLVSLSFFSKASNAAHLRSNIFGSKSGTSTSNDQIDRFGSISPVPDGFLDGESVIGYDVGLANFPLVVSEMAEDLLENGYALVGRRVLGSSLGYNQDSCS